MVDGREPSGIKVPAFNEPFSFGVWTDARPSPGDANYTRRFAELLEEARIADDLGFRSFWTSELHGVDDGYLGAQLPLLAAIAAATERIRLLTAVIVLPFYRLRQVLEAAIVVDLVSQGRLELGVAAGAYAREFSLFRVDMRRRGRLVEEGLHHLRTGFDEGALPDGPGGGLVPLTPRAEQERVPILIGGMSEPAVARAARLGDGNIAYDFERPEQNLPTYFRDILRPALEAASRSLLDFRFVVGVPLWVSEDPERDWSEVYLPAFEYQQARYAEWYEDGEVDQGISQRPALQDHFVGTPEDVAARLVDTWRSAPWQELGFFYRLPGVGHEQALQQLELIQNRLAPIVRRLAAAEQVRDREGT